MMKDFCYADLHCHPNLKTFGHSFDKRRNPKSDMWHTVPPSFYRRKVQQLCGITKFSQTDFTTMTKAKAKIAFVSLYPFEKGFFINKNVTPALAAYLADWGIEIGYERIRYIQKHTDYFTDLLNEYRFVLNSRQAQEVNGTASRWALTTNWNDVEKRTVQEQTIAVILTIEGAHVFNTGLGGFGVPPDEAEIRSNIEAVKAWTHVPLFIGLAHNFNNDLCGHARSLQRLGNLVNQEENINTGLSELGRKVIHWLLDDGNGRRIYIDLKHMSLASRLEYYDLLKTDYRSQKIPLIVSHGAVTGLSTSQTKQHTGCLDIFNANDINFFDEEIAEIARSGGLFAIQMDMAINADLRKIKKFFSENPGEAPVKKSARIIWNQLQYIAEVCDNNGLPAWNCTAVGSDFDGSIHPFPGVLTAAGLEPLSKELVVLAERFISAKTLSLQENRTITAGEIVERFVYTNTVNFLKAFYVNGPEPKIKLALPSATRFTDLTTRD